MIKKYIKETLRRVEEINKKKGLKYSTIGMFICGFISWFFVQGLIGSFLFILFDEDFINSLSWRITSYILSLFVYWVLFYRHFYELAVKKKSKRPEKTKEIGEYYLDEIDGILEA